MAERIPPSRPALKKSVDAGLHPALAGRAGMTAKAPAPASPVAVKGQRAADASRSVTRNAKPLGKAKSAPTSDVLRPTKKDPAVKLTVTMPKSLRKRLRIIAKQSGMEPEELAARILVDGLR